MNGLRFHFSLRKGIMGCGCLLVLIGMGLATAGVLLFVTGIFDDNVSQSVDLSSLGRTYEMHDRLVTGENKFLVLDLSLTGQSSYKGQGNSRRSGKARELAFSIPMHLKILDEDTGKLLHEETRLLGHDRSKLGPPEEGWFHAKMFTVNIPVPDLKHDGNVKYEVTLDKSADYNFTMHGGTFQLANQELGASENGSMGIQIGMLAFPMAAVGVVVLLTGFFVGRAKRN